MQPWEKSPRGLVSWLDVLQFSAYMFFWCGRALREIKTECLVASIPGDGEQPIFHMAAPIDDKARERAKKALAFAEPEFRKVGLTITADMTMDLIGSLEQIERTQNYQWLTDQISTIERLADRELNGKFFLYIPTERAKFWPTANQINPFGDAVATRFPSTTFDAANSGVCLATTTATAAVFHLMRVMEIGLTALGKVFNVSLEHTSWGNAIEQIESKIRDMHKDPVWKALPDCKEQLAFFSQVASQFGIIKDAWRNQTMHVRAKYTEDEAERIFETVKAFMQKLAERLQE